MEKSVYRMEGSFTLTDKKKMQEMNELILELLRKTGIGRLTTKTVNGRKLNVFKQAVPDKNGIVKFDYSVYEKEKRKGNYYDTNTGILVTPDRGNNHFGLTMNMLMTVLESYSETPYYFMYNNELGDVGSLASIIEELTGKVLKFNMRARAFDTTVFFIRDKGYQNFKYDFFAYPFMYTDEYTEQLIYAAFDLRTSIASYENSKDELGFRIKAFHCYKFLKENKELKEEALDYIIRLMDMSLNERKAEKKKCSDLLSVIAYTAEYVPAPFLVQIYAEAYDMDFFELWFRIGKQGYWDVTTNTDKNAPAKRTFEYTHRLKKLYKYENEDNFIGIWDKEDIIISETLAENMQTYKRIYSKIDESELGEFDTIAELLLCLSDMEEVWNIERYIDCNMLEEFIKNKDDIRYKKAIFTLKEMIYEEIKMFSELTETQIRKYILKKVNRKFYAELYWHYFDLLSNRHRREKLLGF